MNPSPYNPPLTNAAVPRQVPGRIVQPIRSFRAHAILVLLIFIIVLSVGFPVARKKGKRKYVTEAVVFVSPRFLKNMDDDKEFELQSNSQYREFVQQNVRTIDRYDIVEGAVERLSKQGHAWQKPQESLEQAVMRLQGELKISPVPDTYQITVQLEGERPEGLAETLNTLVAVFLERSKDEDFYGRDQRLASLKEEAQELQVNIANLGTEKDKIAQELAVSVFSESFSNPFDQLLVGSKQALAAARQKHIMSEAQVASLNHGDSANARTGLEAYAGEMARKDGDITSFQSNLNLRRSELLAKLDGMLPTHPERRQIETELHEIDQIAKSKREELEHTYASILIAEREAEASADARTEHETAKLVDQEAAHAIWYSHNYQRGINIRYEMERARKRLEAVEDRMDFVEQEGRAPGFARLFSPARHPIEPLSGGRKKPIAMLLVLAVAISLATPLAIDYLDPRLLSPSEVEKLLAFAPMGFTLASTRKGSTHDRIQRLAAAIERESERNASYSFVFVPVNAMAPVSATVDELASELVRLGHAVEVIGNPIEQPLELVGTAGIGQRSSASPSLPNAGAFGSLRNRVRDSLQRGVILLISAEPFSAEAETELLVSFCDVVVLTLESGQTTKKELQAVMCTLENIRPRAIAAVVTGYDPNPPMPELRLGVHYFHAKLLKIWQKLADSEHRA